jgi:hypothetical protein
MRLGSQQSAVSSADSFVESVQVRKLSRVAVFASRWPLTSFHNPDFGTGRHVTNKATKTMAKPARNRDVGSIAATSEQTALNLAVLPTDKLGPVIGVPPDLKQLLRSRFQDHFLLNKYRLFCGP